MIKITCECEKYIWDFGLCSWILNIEHTDMPQEILTPFRCEKCGDMLSDFLSPLINDIVQVRDLNEYSLEDCDSNE